MASGLAAIAAERIGRLLPTAPIRSTPVCAATPSTCCETLPGDAARRGLAHGDLNPGNILRHHEAASGTDDESDGWLAIDPKPVHGDLAWDAWPLLTQVGDWTTTVPSAADLVDRTRLVADLTGLDAARMAAWAVARGAESALWAADRGWWTGFRGADGDLARTAAWATVAGRLGG